MAKTTLTHSTSVIFWQEWSDTTDLPGEPAILIDNYENDICLTQEGRYVNISKHELKNFIKELQKIAKEG